jgi:ribosomal-protein-alanine N-acetyltransferase
MSPSPSPLKRLYVSDAAWLAVLDASHAATHQAWSEKLFASFLSNAASYGCALIENDEPAAFILAQGAGDEAEIVNLVTTPLSRRKGYAEKLVNEFAAHMASTGKSRLFLEVAVNNVAAIGLYTKLGFIQCGHRPNYYAQGDGTSLDAILMQKSLNI